MTQFTVYQNKNANSKKTFPYLLDIQSDLLAELNTRIVVPLILAEQNLYKPMTKLTPNFIIEGKKYLMLTPQLAGVKSSDIGKPVADLSYARAEIIAAFDFLISGF